MERAFTHKGHEFVIRAIETGDGYAESISELGRHMSQPGYSWRESSEWDASGIAYPTIAECLDATEQAIRKAIDHES